MSDIATLLIHCPDRPGLVHDVTGFIFSHQGNIINAPQSISDPALRTKLAAGTTSIEITFTGTLNDKLCGWYRSTYTDADGTQHVIAASQMQATDCRRAFPCYLHERKNRPGDALFPNPQGQALSPDAVQQRLSVYVARAQTACPELADKTITVHTLRHTAAMRFLEAGIDTAVIALWLGHESLATTSMYLHADLNIKRAALERTRQPDTPAGDYHPDDPLLTWLQSL